MKIKKFSLLFAILAVFTVVLAACGGNDNANEAGENSSEDTETNETNEDNREYEPEDIDPDTDVCEVCGMAIEDDQFATQIILEDDQVLKFDDLGDLYVWLDENEEENIGAKFVRDFDTEEWLKLEDATYVYDEDIDTPMGFGVISFEEKEDAEAYIEENDGELMNADDLDDHDWEDHDHDHDHGENDDNEHNHDE